RTLDEAALVMALLRPGVRKEDENFLQPPRWDLVREHLHRIVADDADVGEMLRLERAQQASDACAMHLYAEEVPFGMGERERAQVRAVAKADLERAWGIAAVDRDRLEPRGREFDAVFRPQLCKRALLRFGDTPRAGHKRADGARMIGGRHLRRSYSGDRTPHGISARGLRVVRRTAERRAGRSDVAAVGRRGSGHVGTGRRGLRAGG